MNKRVLIQICLITHLATNVAGQNDSLNVQVSKPDSSAESFGIFEDEELLEITLRFDLSTYFRTKPKTEYLKANITFHLSETDSLSRDIRLKTRGEFRNQNCYFAPIELNLKKVDFGYTDLDSIGKLKLVPECQAGGGLNSNYVLREYLIYKLFNLLTDTSFRVRLLRINYIDTEKKRRPISQYGFLIEPLDLLTTRTNSVAIKSPALTQRNVVPFVMDRLAIFNYMIGNYDYSLPGQHNVKVIKPLIVDPSVLAIAVPYDFDWTGFVNAEYAIPAENVGIESIRERLFVGICRTRETYEKALEIFIGKKNEFYNLIDEFPYLNKREKRDMTLYLDEFYNDTAGKKRILDIFLENCKKL
ncbi:MAG: hypothetical protein IQL11_07215 [Bacteroidales bacterium]|nr:hypothetical protein [Bacteroidales bacterium]